jgi:hypothetical protein
MLAVFFAVLLVTASVPAGAVSPQESSDGRTDASEAAIAVEGPPALLKIQAMRSVENLSTPTRRLESAQQLALERLNGSIADHRDPVRIDDSRAILNDSLAVAAVSHFVDTDESDRARNAARLILAADNRTAHVVVRDGDRALDRVGSNVSIGARMSAKAHLRVARRMLERGDRYRERALDRRGRASYAFAIKALRAYAVAHRQARTAIDGLDSAMEPRIEFASREDPIHNGSERIDRRISGRVHDVDPTDLGNVTVYVDGEEVKTVPTRVGRNGTVVFATTLNGTSRVAEVTVEIAEYGCDGTIFETGASANSVESDVNVDVGIEDVIDGEDADSTVRVAESQRDGESWPPWDGGDGRTVQHRVRATVAFDGDGLPDTYERHVTETDPLDPDSDSGATPGDEADNGTIDGREDFDGDGLPTLVERDIGTDPVTADTDGDGLSDGAEVATTGTDPLDADSDGDGTPDGQEDPDGDGLTNAEEVEAGTLPGYADSDGDGLEDPRELELGTDPLDPDTDDDGLRDAVETEEPFETDPLDPDTDDDGVLDGNETYTSTVRNESSGVEIDVKGQGNVGNGISVAEKPGFFGNLSVDAGPTVQVRNHADFETARVEIPIDDSVPKSEYENLSIYKWNGTPEGEWRPIDSTVHEANETITASVDSFSYFAVIDRVRWRSIRRFEPKPPMNLEDKESFSCSGNCTVDGSTLILGDTPSEGQIIVEQGTDRFAVAPLENGYPIQMAYPSEPNSTGANDTRVILDTDFSSNPLGNFTVSRYDGSDNDTRGDHPGNVSYSPSDDWIAIHSPERVATELSRDDVDLPEEGHIRITFQVTEDYGTAPASVGRESAGTNASGTNSFGIFLEDDDGKPQRSWRVSGGSLYNEIRNWNDPRIRESVSADRYESRKREPGDIIGPGFGKREPGTVEPDNRTHVIDAYWTNTSMSLYIDGEKRLWERRDRMEPGRSAGSTRRTSPL